MTAAKPRYFYGYHLAAMAFFLGFVSGAFYLYSRGVFVRDQIADFDASRTQISLAFTAVQLVGTFFAPVLGYLLDRYRVRSVMVSGALWLGFGFIAMSQVQGVLQFAIVTALFIGLGTGTIGTTANSRLLVNWFDRNRGLALAVAIMGYSAAGVVMPPVATWLLDTVGWRTAYVIFGSTCLFAVLPVVALAVKQHPRELGLAPDGGPAPPVPACAPGGDARPFTAAVYRGFVRSPAFWGAAALFGLMGGVFGGLNLHLFLHYTDLGLGDYAAAMILSATAICAFGSKPLLGWLIDRLGARGAALLAALGCVVAMLVFSAAHSPLALLIAGSLFGLAFGGIVPLQAALVSRLFDAGSYGRAYGLLRLCTFPLSAACTPFIGWVYDRQGSYLPVFAVFAVLFTVVALIARHLLPASGGGSGRPARRRARSRAGAAT